MRRIVMATMATITVVTLAFNFDASQKTNTQAVGDTSPSDGGDEVGLVEEPGEVEPGDYFTADPGSQMPSDMPMDTATPTDTPTATATATPGTTQDPDPDPVQTSADPEPTKTSAPPPAPVTKSYRGSSVNADHYGKVQVTITVTDGKITKASANCTASDARSKQINDGAIPKLNAATKAKQSAQIDGVSGATFTSNAYKESLQAALDAAGL